MPKFAVNLWFLFTEVPFLDRFEAAAKAGFKAVEFAFPYAHPAHEVAERLYHAGLKQVLFNLPPGNFEAGDRGLACIPGREREFEASVDKALEYAQALQCPRLHAMAGLIPSGEHFQDCEATYIHNIKVAAQKAAKYGIMVLIEPINIRDVPGYFLHTQAHAQRLLKQIDEPNVAIQLDLYHCQIMEGNLAVHIQEMQGQYAHIQIAGVPGRHEPSIGEINYPYLFNLLDEIGYDGWIGCEYHPKGKTADGLGWIRAYGIRSQ
ncbi:MAG: hydroxypyruvate isomerase family protein [Nitrospira sp.]|nr:hydroxypyruvate isomerase family protein [Nitrospira sp.]